MDYEYEHEYERAKFFFEKKSMVHISKKDGAFFNGLIVELSKKFFIVNDRIKGDQFVMFAELSKPIETYIEKTEVRK